ncbi:MAG TPA: hypothetical protein VM032_17920 [Vicinamibacterales bacterium]|nr:hypothetical protein [Vicinamibacterales bacterium]
MIARAVVLAVLGLLLVAAAASAQSADRSHLEVMGGVRWIGPIDFGAVAASEVTIAGGTRALFNSDTTLDASAGGTLGIGVQLSRRLRAEAAVAVNPTHLRTRISADVEGVKDVTVDAPVTQFLVEGGLVAQASQRRVAGGLPFVTAGLGYLRQLNDGRTLVETGRSYYVGGGLYYVRASNRPRRVKATGLRADLRAQILRGGVAPDSTSHVAAAFTAVVFARF